jgi:hypothetical protein
MKKLIFLLLMFAISCGNIFATEETILDYTTYQTRVTNRNIAEAFSDNVRTYWDRNSYYLCQYQVYQDRSDQNYAWRFRLIKYTYDWGTIFSLIFDVSNGYFLIKLSNVPFISDGVDASQIMVENGIKSGVYKTFVPREYRSFVQRSIMTLKMNNDNYGDESLHALNVFASDSYSY